MNQLIPLIPFLPLIGFAVNGLFGRNLSKNTVGIIGSGVLMASFLLSIAAFNQVAASGPIQSTLYNFFTVDSLSVNFGFLVDQLSVWMMLIVTGVGFLIHVYSVGYMHDDEGFYKFFAYLNLFIFSMLLLIMGDNFLMLFFGWEGVGLASYLLIGFWNQKPAYATASKKAFVMNRVGDMGLSFAIMIAFATLGTTSFEGVAEHAHHASEAALTAIGIMVVVAAAGKSAQFPLQAWLGDAMAGPTPVSALIHAATMVTAGVYLIVRSNFIFEAAPTAQLVVVIVGAITLIFGALIGTAKDDIKKALAASTMSQIGYMILAAGLGPVGYVFAIMHLLTHGFFKASMFLGAGSVMHGMNDEVALDI